MGGNSHCDAALYGSSEFLQLLSSYGGYESIRRLIEIPS